MKLVLDQCKQGFVSHKAALSSTQHPTKADQVEDGHTDIWEAGRQSPAPTPNLQTRNQNQTIRMLICRSTRVMITTNDPPAHTNQY